MQDLAEGLSASVGGFVAVTLTYPIEIVKNRVASALSSAEKKGNPEQQEHNTFLCVFLTYYLETFLFCFLKNS